MSRFCHKPQRRKKKMSPALHTAEGDTVSNFKSLSARLKAFPPRFETDFLWMAVAWQHELRIVLWKFVLMSCLDIVKWSFSCSLLRYNELRIHRSERISRILERPYSAANVRTYADGQRHMPPGGKLVSWYYFYPAVGTEFLHIDMYASAYQHAK